MKDTAIRKIFGAVDAGPAGLTPGNGGGDKPISTNWVGTYARQAAMTIGAQLGMAADFLAPMADEVARVTVRAIDEVLATSQQSTEVYAPAGDAGGDHPYWKQVPGISKGEMASRVTANLIQKFVEDAVRSVYYSFPDLDEWGSEDGRPGWAFTDWAKSSISAMRNLLRTGIMDAIGGGMMRGK